MQRPLCLWQMETPTPDLTNFILIALATWRVATMLVNEAGPLDIFERIRDRFIPEGEITGFLPNLLTCVWCLSVWTGIFCYLVWLIWAVPIIILAASAIAVILDRFVIK